MPASKLCPAPPKRFLTIGTITIKPKNPMTTEGIPDNKLIAGLNKLASFFGAISARKIAVNMPTRTPVIVAPMVMDREPIIIGRIPKLFEVGAQLFPNINLNMPILNKEGVPLMKIYKAITKTERIEKQAEIKNIASIILLRSSFLLSLSKEGLNNLLVFMKWFISTFLELSNGKVAASKV